MNDEVLHLNVDGSSLEARPGQMLIEVTDAHGIYIPRFCYHKKLSVAANCRMCLVEVEKAPKPLPACATPVADGMKVHTRSELTLEAQRSVMEFLLINHPLDCPICDQGGECELQDLAMGYGEDVSRYQEKKRVVQDKNIGPLIQTDMTRCIHCTRCVRFGEEIAGLRELGATGRGEHMEIGTYIEKSLKSELSGNVIDVCPVGALTSKPFRYSARAWEMTQCAGIAPHDSVGSNLHLHVKEGRVMRVAPAENEDINEVWLSDRDRFGYEGLYSNERLRAPMIKKNGRWLEVSWEEALDFTDHGLRDMVERHGAGQLGGLVSPAATLEELYLFQKLLRGLGCDNIDSRLRQKDFEQQEADPVFPYLGQSIVDLERLDAALLIGSNVRKEQPLLNHRLRKAVLRGADVMLINAVDWDFNYETAERVIAAPSELPATLLGVVKALAASTKQTLTEKVRALCADVKIKEAHRRVAKKLLNAGNATVLLGNGATAHAQFSGLKYLASLIADLSGARFGFLSEAANSSGAWLAGALPHRDLGGVAVNKAGLDADAMLAQSRKAYLLLGVEPEQDCWDGAQALSALQSADFVVSVTAYRTETMRQYADALLPMAAFAETPGAYVNVEGRLQSCQAVLTPVGEARPAWKILRLLGGLLGLEHFDFADVAQVRETIMRAIEKIVPDSAGAWSDQNLVTEREQGPDHTLLHSVAETPAYGMDALLRRATALRQAAVEEASIRINAALAERCGVADGELAVVEGKCGEFNAPVVISDRVSDHCVLLSDAHVDGAGVWRGRVRLRKA